MSKTKAGMEQMIMMPNMKQNNRIIHNTMSSQQYAIYMNDFVDQPSEYIEELELIRSLSEHDSVTIYLNNGGGDMDTAIEFVNTIAETDGHVHAHITGSCMSAASMIALGSHSWSLSTHVAFMVHQPAGGIGGKFNELHAYSDFYQRFTNEFFTNIYRGFLTKKEIKQVLEGKTFYFDRDETEQRLIKLSEYKQKQMEKMEADIG